MAFPYPVLLVASRSSNLAIDTVRIGTNQIAELDWVTSLKDAQAACQLQKYAAYLVEQNWLGQFLSSLPVNHSPVIALVTNPEAGQQALDMGAADYLAENDLPTPIMEQYYLATLERSLRLTITAHQRLLELKESEQKFQQLTGNIDSVYCLMEADLSKVIYVSPNYSNIWGESAELLLEDIFHWVKSIHPDDQQMMAQRTQIALFSDYRDISPGVEHRIVRPDGEVRWVYDRIFPVRDEQGKTYRLVTICDDITDRKLIEETTRQQEAKYRGLFNLLPGGMVLVFDQDLRLSLARGKALVAMRLTSEGLEGCLLKDVLAPEEFALIEPHYQAVLTGASPNFEFIYQERCYLVYTSPIRDGSGNVSGGIAAAYDITERKYVEQALKYSEARFRAIFERSPMGIALVSIERKIFQVNTTFCEILGYTETNLLGMSARDITHPEDLEITDGNISYLLNREINYFTLEKRYLRRDGSYCWVQSAVAAVKDAQNSLQYMLLLITDIQEQKQTEQRVEYRLHLESIVTTISQHLLSSEMVNLDWIMEILGKAVECDRAYINWFSDDLNYSSVTHEWCSQKSTPTAHFYQNIPTATCENWFNSLKRNQDIVIDNINDLPLSLDKNCHDENQNIACLEVPIFSSQRKLWISLCFESMAPRNWFPEDAQLLRLVGEMIFSYHEKLQNQRELKASAAIYASIFNHAISNIFLIQVHYSLDPVDRGKIQDIKFTYETINPAQERTLGMTTAEVAGKTPTDILCPTVAAWVEHQYLACVRGGEVMTYEESFSSRNELRYYITTLVPIRDEITGQIVKLQGSARDITQVKMAEQERLRQERYQQLLFSLTLKIRESSELSEILETTVDELQKSLKIDRVLIWQFNSDRTGKVAGEAFTEGLQKMDSQHYAFGPMPQDLFGLLQQVTVIQVAEMESVDLPPSYWEFMQYYEIKSCLNLPILLTSDRQPNQAPLLWGLLSLYQCQGFKTWEPWEIEQLQQMANQLGIAIYQAQLLDQERRHVRELAAYNVELAEFNYIASHDLQTPLGTISNYGSLLQSRYSDQLDATGIKFLTFITNAAQRMGALIDDLLFYNLFNRDQPSFLPTDCNLAFQEAYDNLEFEIVATGAVINHPNLPTVLGVHSQLVQLFQNLLGNSLKYRGSEALVIEINVISQDQQWLFSCRDNGIGLDTQHGDRIFQIFQRLHTQQEYSGTGVGLAVCKKVVELHGGRIWVESQPGQGATFYFTLNSASL